MIVKLMFSPKYQIEEEEEGEVPPHLQRWSDLTFLVSIPFWLGPACNGTNLSQMYYYEVMRAGGGGQDKVPPPDYIIIDLIDNGDTEAVVEEVLRRDNKAMSAWPGSEYDTSSESGKGLLATVHGKAVTWLLVSHKAQFGIVTISKITIMGSSVHQFSLLFTMDRVEAPMQPSQASMALNRMGAGQGFKAML